MQGWQAVNTDAEVWDIVTFLMASEGMTQADLAAMDARPRETQTSP